MCRKWGRKFVQATSRPEAPQLLVASSSMVSKSDAEVTLTPTQSADLTAVAWQEVGTSRVT